MQWLYQLCFTRVLGRVENRLAWGVEGWRGGGGDGRAGGPGANGRVSRTRSVCHWLLVLVVAGGGRGGK